MKKNLLFIFALCCSLTAFSDTIDHVKVYLNETLVKEFNIQHQYVSVEIPGNQIKETDVITIEYVSDSDDEKYVYVYNIHNWKNQQLNDIVGRAKKPATIDIKSLSTLDPFIKDHVYYFDIIVINKGVESAPAPLFMIKVI